MHPGVIAYYGQKCGWLPLYSCLADMPVEIGEVYFLCVAHDQAKDAEERMLAMARQKQEELRERLTPGGGH